MGGVVFRAACGLRFVPASIALELMTVPSIARVPGAPPELAGIALVHGATTPVITIGPSRSAMLLCQYLGERIGLVGFDVVACGRFEPHADHVVAFGEQARFFDLAAALAKVQEGRWAV